LLLTCFAIFISPIFAQKTGSLEETTETQEETVFTRGSRIIFSDDFSKDAVNDFPAKWTTTKSGEIKKLKGFDTQFLKISDGAVVAPQLTKPLPEHFTVEYDIIVPSDVPMRMASVGFGAKPFVISNLLSPKNGLVFSFHSFSNGIANGLKFGTQNSTTSQPGLQKIAYKTPLDKVIKVAISVNKQRIRFYVDGVKMVDMPNAFNPLFRKSVFFCPSTHGAKESKLNYFYITNVIIAEAGTDRRSQVLKDLMENGSFSTNAIQFATNSDKLTAASNDIIQQIADALKENMDIKLQIIGHTDSDGDASQNLLLSKKRANAVKVKLISLGINTNRLTTDGKGENAPVADNKTSEGKAENRRVEFIKM
jgi:outer membrane protein OmpA-like peptidoglycan-associated protein